MADNLTPEELDELIKRQKELNDLKESGQQINEAELKSLNQIIEANKKVEVALSKQMEALKNKIAILDETANQEESSYVRRIREQELEESRLKLLELQKKELEEQALTVEGINEEQRKQLDDLNKLQVTIQNMRSARKANNDLLDSRSKTQMKIEQSILRIADLAQRGDLVKGLYKGISSVASDLFDRGFSKLISETKSFLFEFDNVTMAFERQFQLGPKVQKSIQGIYESNIELGASIEDVTNAYGALQTTVTDFTTMSQGTRDELADLSVLQGRLGIAEADFAQGIQNSIKFYGQSAEQAGNTSLEINKLAEGLGRSPGEMAAEFAKAGPQLVKFGNQGIKAFKDLSRISRLTGMEMDKILSMTNRFDTFEGAAEQAGKLNAALGGNMVNAMDLMTTTDPAERFNMIRDAIADTGLTFDEMSYYQKQYFAEAAGLENVSDLALMMSGDMSLLPDAHQQTADEIKEERRQAQELLTVQEQLKTVMMDLAKEALPLLEYMRDFAQVLANNKGTVKAVAGALILMKGAMMGIAFAQALNNTRLLAGNLLKFKSIGLSAKKNLVESAGTGINTANAASTGAYATAVGTLATAQQTAMPFAKAYAKMMGFVSKSLLAAVPGFTAFGAAALKASVPLGVFLAGMVGLAFVIEDTPWETLLAAAGMIIAIGIAFVKGAAGISTGLTLLANPKAILGAKVLSLTLLAVAVSVKLIADAFTNMFTVLGIGAGGGSILEFAMAMTTIAVAGTALIPASVGITLFAIGVVAFAGALALVDSEKLRSMADFAQGMAAMETSNLTNLAELLERVAAAMESIPLMKAITIKSTLDAAAIASRAAAAVPPAGGGNTNQFSRAVAAGEAGARSRAPINVNVTLELDGEVLARKTIKDVENAKSSGGMLDAIGDLLA